MTALMDAVASATAGVSRLYRLNAVPSSPTYPYGTFSAALGGGDAYSLDASHGTRAGSVVVQTFGKTADSATDLMEQVIDALLDRRLVADATPLQALFTQPALNRDPDDNGVVTATMPFTFAKEA